MIDDLVLPTGPKDRFKANVAAIKVLKTIETELRSHATPDEQQILMGFSGWGALPQVLSWEQDPDGKWENERQLLRGLLTPAELAEAADSTPFAHYTDPDVIRGMWLMAARMGFAGGRVLETSAGTGRFFGYMPEAIASESVLVGVEKELVTGQILKLLYPRGDMQTKSFQEFDYPEGFFDLAISNVPFADVTIMSDERYRHLRPQLHDYCILKGMDCVRPGGLGMWITSTGTLDKSDDRIRRHLFKTSDLVAAFRLPEGGMGTAGTSVVCDVVILRRRLAGEVAGDATWLGIHHAQGVDGTTHALNGWFTKHPAHILGDLDGKSRLYRGGAMHVSMTPDYAERFAQAVAFMPATTYAASTANSGAVAITAAGNQADKNLDSTGRKRGSLVVINGGIYQEQGPQRPLIQLHPEPTDDAALRDRRAKAFTRRIAVVTSYVDLRDTLNELLNAQVHGENHAHSEALREALNAHYDTFVSLHGPLHKRSNVSAIEDCPDANMVLGVERWDGTTAAKSEIFRSDTTRSKLVIAAGGVTKASDAIALSLNDVGFLNVAKVGEYLGLTEIEAGARLSGEGLAFRHPTEGWQTADDYLTGDVVEKLRNARIASAADPQFVPNVAALERVVPPRISHDEIAVNLGAPWIPAADIARFSAELLGVADRQFDIRYNTKLGEWLVGWSTSGSYLAHSQEARMIWGTKDANYIHILEALIKRRPIAVYKRDHHGNVWSDENGKARLDRDATEAVAAKGAEIEERFRDWIWDNQERKERLVQGYNDTYNSVVPRTYDGSHLTFPGMVKPCTFENGMVFKGLRAHQANTVWQTVCRGNALVGHEVGTGKTMTQVAIAMELRRLGLARKPTLLCLKSNINQITNEAHELYPGAKILSAFKEFDAATREETVARIATGDWDLVILTHDQFGCIPISSDFIKRYIGEQLDHLGDMIQSLGGDPENDEKNMKSRNREVKQLAKARLRMKEKLEAAIDRDRDNTATFEQTGIDFLIVDEAHRFKSLPIHTSMGSVKGIPNSDSDKAMNLDMVVSYLHATNNGRGVAMATGTPVVNSLCEVYVMQRFVQPHELKKRGIFHFDAWAANFGSVTSRMEFTHAGDYKPVQRFAQFVNLPELQKIAFQDFSIVRATTVNEIVRPQRHDIPIEIKPTQTHLDCMQWLQNRAKELEEGDVDPREDNHLSVSLDGCLLTTDLRLVMREVAESDLAESKTRILAARIADDLRQHPGKSHLVFSEINQSNRTGFNLIEDLVGLLEAQGIPRKKVEIFSGMSDVQRLRAADRINQGISLVGIGNTQTLGTGINCQRNLIGIHHLDAPWTPAAMEQRNGRAWRQGNTNKHISIYSYVVGRTLDSWRYQTLSRKERFIRAFMDGQSMKREVVDEDTEALGYDRIMAIASGNPLLYERINTAAELERLERAERRHLQTQNQTRATIAKNEQEAVARRTAISQISDDVALYQAHRGTDFRFSLPDGTVLEDPKAAGALILERLGSVRPRAEVYIGIYRGFEVHGRRKPTYDDFDSGLTSFLRRNDEAIEWSFTASLLAAETQEVVFSSINSKLASLPVKLDHEKLELKRNEAATEKLRDEAGKSFRFAQDLARKRLMLSAIDEALASGHSALSEAALSALRDHETAKAS